MPANKFTHSAICTTYFETIVATFPFTEHSANESSDSADVAAHSSTQPAAFCSSECATFEAAHLATYI
jgi:hypothetical protein